MDIKWCFEPDCKFEAEYMCKCSFPWTYSCKQHAGKHMELPNKIHTFEFILIDPSEETKEAILEFLTKEKLEHIKLEWKILAAFTQYLLNLENYMKDLIKNLDSSSDGINNCCLKIEEAKKISKQIQSQILELLSLQPSDIVDKVKMMIPINSDWMLFCVFSEKIKNMVESLVKDKFEVHLDKRLSKIECIQEDSSKSITPTNNALANLKDLISSIINENSESLKELENIKEPIKLKAESDSSLLNFQINSITNDLSSSLKETETL